MTADVNRDGAWAVAALKSAADYSFGSSSVGCEIRERSGEIVMNRAFADLLVTWCIRTNERLDRANCLLRQQNIETQ